MKMRWIFFIFVLLAQSLRSISSPMDTVCISGHVHGDDNLYVAGLIVSVLLPADSSMVTYALTDKDGAYAVRFVTGQPEVLVRLSGLNVKPVSIRAKAKSQALDIVASGERVRLREVQVRARKLWGGRDTLNYLVSSYSHGGDRSIGDVLVRMPGITMDGGQLKYQGSPIGRFYIENLDVLQGKYGIAVEGLRAEDVATVQVLEDHEHVRALGDRGTSDAPAINLRLKERAKGAWTRSVSAGVGEGGGLLLGLDADMMYFGKRRQNIIYYGYDNMGTPNGRSVSQYGGNFMEPILLTHILDPGLSPVGNALENNRHTVNASNLAKIDDATQLHYNLSYAHDIQHRSSYQETAYLLPSEGIRMVSENATLRQTENEASILLSYESNKDSSYMSSALSMYGKWVEENGGVTSSKEEIQQHGYNRSLALSCDLRWVRRVSNGGGYEVRSVSGIESAPQALSVGGDMLAVQRISLTKLKSSSKLTFVRGMRIKRWTLAPYLQLDAEYVRLASILQTEPPDFGKMEYLHAMGRAGGEIRYSDNNLTASLQLPMSLLVTRVSSGDDRMRLSPSPLLSVRWKPNDFLTLLGKCGYVASQTPWSQLVPFYIMSDYRTVSRYIPKVSYVDKATAGVKIAYKDIMRSFFSYVSGTISRSWHDVIYGNSLDELGHVSVQAQDVHHHRDSRQVAVNVSKGFDWHRLRMEAMASYRHNSGKVLRQGMDQTMHDRTYVLEGSLDMSVLSGLSVGYGCNFSSSVSRSFEERCYFSSFNQRLNLSLALFSDRIYFSSTAKHSHNGGYSQKDHCFVDVSLRVRTKGKAELSLELSNLTGTRDFVMQTCDELTQRLVVYHLRPFSVSVRTRVNL